MATRILRLTTKPTMQMQIRGHILLLRVIDQRHVDLMKENWSEQKKSISQVLLGLTSCLTRENSLDLKLLLTGSLLLLHQLSLDYFYHHQVFVYTHGAKNLFVTNSSRLMFSCRFVKVSCNNIQFNESWKCM